MDGSGTRGQRPRAPGAAVTSRRLSRAEGVAALGIGLALLVAYACLARDLATGLAEFGYFPFVPNVLPFSPMRGFTWEQLVDHGLRLVVVGPALVLLSIAAYRLLPASFARRLDAGRWATLAGAASVGAIAFVMLAVLRGRALVDDELTYRMQGAFLLEGHVTGPDVGFFPGDLLSVRAGGTYTGKYLFGEGLVQAAGILVHRPALLHLPLAALALAAWHRAVRLAAGPAIAGWATLFVAIGPMFILTTATGMSQATSFACLVFAGLGYEWARGPRPRTGAAVVAAAIGLGLATRPQTALPAGAVLGLATAWALWRRHELGALAILLVVGACTLAPIAAYDRTVSGSAWKLPWYLQCLPEHYGFGPVWRWGRYSHTLRTALENQAVVLVRFNAWWMGWPLGLGVFALWWRLGRPSLGCAIWVGVGAAIALFEAGYYSTGVSDTGPIYHLELVLPASMIAANTMVAALDRWPRAAAATLAVHVALGTGSFLVVQTARLHRLVEAIHADSDAALAKIPGRALLLYESRGSEVIHVGWLLDDFPRRYRSDGDRVVTYPRPPRARLDGLLARYPGRTCWYYHRDPATERAELLPCADAGAYLDRSFVDLSPARDLWIRPTAFKRTSYDPWAGIRALKTPGFLDQIRPCCILDDLRAQGARVQDSRCDL